MEFNFLFQKKEIKMTTLIHPTYFPNIEHFNHLLNSNSICFEINDFYQKQTLRNRTTIYGSSGKLNLSIPIKYSYKKKEKLKDIKICNDTKWQKNHLKSIQISYRSSPYFEFFEDYFSEIFEKKEIFLVDISIKSIKLISLSNQLNINSNQINIKLISKQNKSNQYQSIVAAALSLIPDVKPQLSANMIEILENQCPNKS